jgi:hypothetical protein
VWIVQGQEQLFSGVKRRMIYVAMKCICLDIAIYIIITQLLSTYSQ